VIGAVLRATPRQGWGWVGLGRYSVGCVEHSEWAVERGNPRHLRVPVDPE
jgi:hypothetical protein